MDVIDPAPPHAVIDDGLLLYMPGPNSYTGEDVIELQGHGGVLVTTRVLDAVLRAGASPAEPGEFTLRAFLNGRVDLAQAEAVGRPGGGADGRGAGRRRRSASRSPFHLRR